MPRKTPDKAGAEGTTPRAPRKKKYQKPRLAEYGDLRQIVQAKASNRSDGAGLPATKR